MMNKKGVTLIELIVSVAIFTIIASGLWRMVRGGTRTFVRARQQSEVIDSGERALRGFQQQQGMLKEIRRCSGVKNMQADTLSMTGPAGSVTYFLQSNRLMKAVTPVMSVTATTMTVAGDVTAVGFRYFVINTGLVSVATSAVTVNSVEVRLHIKKNETDYDLVSSARFRN